MVKARAETKKQSRKSREATGGSAGHPRLEPKELERLARVFRSLGDPLRLAILQELKAGEATPSELQQTLGTSLPNISKHLRFLSEVGLVEREKRGMHVFYTIGDAVVEPLCELVCGKLERDAETDSFARA